MQLVPTDDQSQVSSAVADMLRGEAAFDRWFTASIDMLLEEDRLLKFGTDMGWLGFGAPEAIGGSQAGVVEEILMLRELGARLCPIGTLARIAAAKIALSHGRDDLASLIVVGEAAVGWLSEAEPGTLISAAGASYAISMTHGRAALVSARPEKPITLGWDGMTSFARTTPSAGHDEHLQAEAAHYRFIMLGLAALLQGVAGTAVQESNEYAKGREQFGRAIGSFQAVRHRIADMEMASQRARASLYYGAVSLSEQRDDAELQITVALHLASEAALMSAKTNIANHGAIGVTVENVGHLLLKRALLLRAIAGQPDALLDRIGEENPPTI